MENKMNEIYEMSIVGRVTWQAHSLSNAGTNGSIRTMSRCQMLADGVETDACSGNIAKFHHAALLVEYFSGSNVPVCNVCREHDGCCAYASDEKDKTIKSIIRGCGICDCHGFLIPEKKANDEEKTEHRERSSKASLIEFSMALVIPGKFWRNYTTTNASR